MRERIESIKLNFAKGKMSLEDMEWMMNVVDSFIDDEEEQA